MRARAAVLAPAQPAAALSRAGWWGARCFVSAGCLEGLSKDVKTRARGAFDEDEQARIYTAAHAGKAQGKVGLGQGTGTIKAGGVKWEGRKVTFKEDEETGGEAASAPAAARLAAAGSSTRLDALGGSASGEVAAGGQQQQQKKKKKQKTKVTAASDTSGEAAPQPPQPVQQRGKGRKSVSAAAAGATQGGWEASVKWKKLITRTLQAAPGRQLRVRELQQQVVAAVLARHAAAVAAGGGKGAVKAALATRLAQRSRLFAVDGKVVRLAGAGASA